jgi:hypothetical protein
LVEVFQQAGIDVIHWWQGIQAFQEGRATLWPEFEEDEIARLFST